MMVMKGRVRVAREKADFVRSLKASENPTSPFQTYADIITFAAALGAKRNRRIALGETSRKEPDPVPQDQFFTRGYAPLMNLLAVFATGDPKVLGNDEQSEDLRIQVFEEFANAGFEILQIELTGSVDYGDRILLLMSQDQSDAEEFDLTKFL